MRILMINYEFPPIGGGGGNVTYYISKNLALRGHDVCVITSQFRSLPKNESLDGFEVRRVPVLRKSPNVCGVHEMLTFVISASIYSLWFVRKFHPEVVHVFFGIPSGPVAYLLKKAYKLPYILFLGGRDVPRPHPDPPIYRLLYGILLPAIRSIWGSAEAVVACSNGLSKMALNTLHNLEVTVIPDGVDLSRFHPVEKDPDPERVKLLAVGRLIPRKGFDYLIRSLPEVVRAAKKDFRLEIVGDGPLHPELIRLAEQLQVADRITFAGAVPYEQLAQKYQSADIFVLSSLAEGMPLVVLEAMASGLPIVASKVQGIDELVTEGVNGYLFPPADHRALSQCLITLINNDAVRLQMGKRCTEMVRKYDWANITQTYLRLYESARDKK